MTNVNSFDIIYLNTKFRGETMLVTMKEMLADARARHYCVAAFDVSNYEMARNVYNELKDQVNGIHHIETELSCCIGKQDVRMFVTAYDENNVPVYEAVEEEKIKPSVLIKKYGLDKPHYADLCRYGLFSCIGGGKK